MLVLETIWHAYWEKFVELSFCDQRSCFADFVGTTLLAVFFLLPLPNCFLRVCLPTFFAAVLKFFLPLTTSSICGEAKSNKSAYTGFPIGTILLRKTGNAVLLKTCASATPVYFVQQNIFRMEFLISRISYLVTSFMLEGNVGSIFKHQNKTSDIDRQKGCFYTARVSQVNVNARKRILKQRSEL